jgi:hypothetical protein
MNTPNDTTGGCCPPPPRSEIAWSYEHPIEAIKKLAPGWCHELLAVLPHLSRKDSLMVGTIAAAMRDLAARLPDSPNDEMTSRHNERK